MLETRQKSPFYAQGLQFSCQRCSACCRYESGYVFLSRKDLSQLGTALNMDRNELINTYCRWIPCGNGFFQLSLREKSNYDCIFWGGAHPSAQDGCSIYKNRPLQCRAFPFWASVLSDKDSWDTTAIDCPGMDQGDLHSRPSIEDWLAMRHNEPIISRGVD